MAWGLGIMAALWVLLFWSSPGAAAIERFVDSRGVVHIRNTGSGAKNSPADAGAKAPVSLASPLAAQPEAPPVQPPAAHLAPQPQGPQSEPEATPGHPAPRAAPSPGAIQIAAEPPLGTKSTGEEASGNRLPLQRVSYPGTEPAAVQGSRADRGPDQPEVAAEGAIRRYRDSRGVMHISNVRPETELAPPMLVATPAGAGSLPLARENTADTPIKKVSLPETTSAVAATMEARAATAPSPVPGSIRRYRDSLGVLHIENVASEGQEAKPPPMLARPGKIRKHIEIFGSDGAPALPLQKTAWPAEAVTRDPPLGVPREISPPKGEILSEGSIRRYRDAKGVLHIESVEPPKQGEVPGPMLLVRPKTVSPGSPAYTGLPPPGNPAGAFAGPGPPPDGSRVTAFKDRRGRLIIRNQEPELQVAGMPRREQTMAQLAPVLQEASLLYGLPVTLIQSLITVESNFVSWAVSPKGAMGLMQLMPGTAAFLGVRDAFDLRENIHGGCRYLRLLLDYFGGSLPLALAAYNAGHQRVVSCGFQIPPIKETQEFVTQVLGRFFLAEKRGRRPWV